MVRVRVKDAEPHFILVRPVDHAIITVILIIGVMAIGRMIVPQVIAILMAELVRHVHPDITVHREQTMHRDVQMRRQIRTMSAPVVHLIHVRGIVMPDIMDLRPPAVRRARRAAAEITVPAEPRVPHVLVSLIMAEPRRIVSKCLL